MSTDSRRRILKDLTKVDKEPALEVFAAPNEENIMECDAVIFGYCLRDKLNFLKSTRYPLGRRHVQAQNRIR
jgi:hypothetical protein